MKIVSESNKKLIKYQKKVYNLESKFKINVNSNIIELEKFYKKFNQYKYICKILFDYPNFYSIIKFIDINQIMLWQIPLTRFGINNGENEDCYL
jgi:hypothetical protein